LAQAISRRNYLLLQSLQRIKKADLVIGHNPGALYATYRAAALFGCKAGFDVEDYHPGEGNDNSLKKITGQYMRDLLPEMNYVSFAAPLIRQKVRDDLSREGRNWITVLNYFPRADFLIPEPVDGPLKLVWFSQNINVERGLEFVLPLVREFTGEIELHLYGNMDQVFYESWLKGMENVIVHEPLPQVALHRELNKYDVGLALELANDINRSLCITNKLIAYMQAGLFVLASDTKAQNLFIGDFPGSGVSSNLHDPSALSIVFKTLLDEKEHIRQNKLLRFQNFINTNWETASEVLLNQWK
jgi:glycosyltransferase involved in cell wall biosynthesis